MANKRISEGVGKKIVEALKKQSEIEINAKTEDIQDEESLDFSALEDDSQGIEGFNAPNTAEETNEVDNEEVFNDFSSQQDDFSSFQPEKMEVQPQAQEEAPTFDKSAYSTPAPDFSSYQQPNQAGVESFVSELDTFEIPNNIAVLKKLITQLPKGVTRHTGAQIIRQTMEALGISMKSVLQEAQQVQEGLNNSAKECQATIQEYKKQIIALEKQAQNHQRQYAALNELISLFVQTSR